MAISSKRFSVIGEETNMAVTSLNELKDSFIRNNPAAELKALSSNLEGFVQNAMSKIPTELESSVDEAIRSTKDLIADMKNIDLLSVKDLDKRLSDLFPDNPIAKSIFSQLSDKCKKDSLAMEGLGKPYSPSISCNGRKTNTRNNDCNAGKYGDILNKLSGGAYSSTHQDLNGMLKKILALASFGYKMNMCGVFNAITGGMDHKGMLSRASAGLLGMMSKARNSLGALDIIGASAGLTPLLELPGAIPMTLSAFKMPEGFKEFDMSSMCDRMLGGAELLNPDFGMADDYLSITEFGDYNEDLAEIMTASRKEFSFDEDTLDLIPDTDHVFRSAAYETMGFLDSHDNIANVVEDFPNFF